MTADGKPIAKAKTPVVAEDIADRLNEDDHRLRAGRMGGLVRFLQAVAQESDLVPAKSAPA